MADFVGVPERTAEPVMDDSFASPPERAPVRTWAELATLDHDEIMEGYQDGFAREPEPGDNRSKAYWHGWRNGHMDRFGGPPDPDAIALIQDMRRLKAGVFADGAGLRGPASTIAPDAVPGSTTSPPHAPVDGGG